MEREVVLGKRVLLIRCLDKESCEVGVNFIYLLKEIKRKIIPLMNKYKIPKQIIVHFKKGNYKLDGLYHVQNKSELKHFIIIEIYTKQIRDLLKKGDISQAKLELIHTFAHELIHNKHKKERITEKLALDYLKKFGEDFKKK